MGFLQSRISGHLLPLLQHKEISRDDLLGVYRKKLSRPFHKRPLRQQRMKDIQLTVGANLLKNPIRHLGTVHI